MQPKVSIILPCFKVEKYLDRCMNSLINQTLTELEIILVDDKSPDATPIICDEWCRKDNRVKVVHKHHNEGAGYARNTGLEIASGEYLAFLDSDDFIDQRMIEDLFQYASNNNLDCVFCGYNFWHGETDIVRRQEKDNYVISDTNEDVRQVLLDLVGSKPNAKSDASVLTALWKGLYKKDVIISNKIRFVSERDYAAEDFIFFLDFVPCCKRIGFIPQCYYYYCDNETSITRSYQPKRFQMEMELYSIVDTRMRTLGFREFEYKNRLDRYLQLKTRACIAQCAKRIHEKGYINMRNEVLKIVNNSVVRDYLHRFPYHELHFHHKIFFLLLKYRMVDLLLLLLK